MAFPNVDLPQPLSLPTHVSPSYTLKLTSFTALNPDFFPKKPAVKNILSPH
jgi:hypothetical protein